MHGVEPARRQLAVRPAGLRPAGRAGRGRVRAARLAGAPLPDDALADAGRGGARAVRARGRREPVHHPARPAADDARPGRHHPHRAGAGAGARADRGAQGAGREPVGRGPPAVQPRLAPGARPAAHADRVSECIARAALERAGEPRRAHPRRLPGRRPEWGKINLDLLARRRTAACRSADQPLPQMPAGARARSSRRRRHELRRARSGSGAATPTGGDLQDFTVEVERGRGRPRRHPPAPGHPGRRPRRPLELQGRQVRLVQRRDQRPAAADVHDPDEHVRPRTRPITVTPLRTFPVIRDLVTDVSFNYEKARADPGVHARGRGTPTATTGCSRTTSSASQEFRKCIECFLCQDVCHVIRDHEENKAAFAGPRFLIRLAELDMHPLDIVDRAGRRAGRVRARATATSPSAAPRSAPRTSTSPTTASSR